MVGPLKESPLIMARRYEEEAGGFGFGSSSGRPAQGGGDFVDISKVWYEKGSAAVSYLCVLRKREL